MKEWLASAICVQVTVLYAWLRRTDSAVPAKRRAYISVVIGGAVLSLLLVLQTPTVSSFVRPAILEAHDLTGDGVPALLLLIVTVLLGIKRFRAANDDPRRLAAVSLIVLGCLLTFVALAVEPVIYQATPRRDSFH